MGKLGEGIRANWPLLMSHALYYLFEGMSAAVIGKEVYAILPPQLISLQSIIGWGGGILLGLMWTKWNKKLLPLMIPFFLMQSVATVIYFVYAEATLNMFVFWVIGQGMYIMFGGIADKIFDCALAWFYNKSEARSTYDNLTDMTSCVAGFSGYLISMIYVPSLRAAIAFNFLANFAWCLGILIYSFRHKSKLTEDSQSADGVAE